ncbi:MAG: hypothetical protein JXA99_16250 [Candidatus Lokiarchaeota archaeon]|nr:hypothetical protein [Candidatus Lokiarchaeota archaeon]
MNEDSSYNELYKHWVKEFESAEVTPLSDEDLKNYKELLKEANALEKKYKDDDEIINEINLQIKNNINFLFDDLLKIRRIKIINNTLMLKEINLNHLFEAEQLLYKNLIASFKGYDKIVSISGEDIQEYEKIKTNYNISTETKLSEITKQSISTNDNEINFQNQKQSLNIFDKITYRIIRFIETTPSLVGIDLINYGPFIKEDIANLPQDNAIILVNEKVAEFIELN